MTKKLMLVLLSFSSFSCSDGHSPWRRRGRRQIPETWAGTAGKKCGFFSAGNRKLGRQRQSGAFSEGDFSSVLCLLLPILKGVPCLRARVRGNPINPRVRRRPSLSDRRTLCRHGRQWPPSGRGTEENQTLGRTVKEEQIESLLTTLSLPNQDEWRKGIKSNFPSSFPPSAIFIRLCSFWLASNFFRKRE